ncbi:MAG TPA: geranylgeranylglyceryl/heptaprenylglyceryl phosphate synthase [Candidatus Korarchaeota archaeon]|nr:geranylgeranylglyceryl/heptaprenylglyceryl phosphate synthase [Candidatus Korarchaeota archaeon]
MGEVEKYLKDKSSERTLLAALIDPVNVDIDSLSRIASDLEDGGADLILVGGSIAAGAKLEEKILRIKSNVSIPVVLFPGNVDGVVPGADAILFMSLLNSGNPYWIIQAQALAAPKIKRLGIEPIPTAYLIFEPGHMAAAGWVGWVNPIPRKKPEIAIAYALAAEMLGIRWIYLEAGSGAERPIPSSVIKSIAKLTNLGIIVGGGLRTPEQISERAKAGANIVVIGTKIEESKDIKGEIATISSALKGASKGL